MFSPTGFVRVRVIVAVLAAAAVLGILLMRANSMKSEADRQSLDRTMSNFISNLPTRSTLDPIYQDNDGDLLADPPENADLALKPTELP